MLSESVKRDVKEITTILLNLDDIGRVIMLSNAVTLLARQEITKDRNEICKGV